MNTNFKVNASGAITALGAVLTNNLIDTGIVDDKIVEIDSLTVATNDYARFTANGLEGRSYSEVVTDLSLNNVENTKLSTWPGTTNITKLGTIATGTWQGTKVGVAYGGTDISSYTSGDILYASGATSLSKLGIGSANTFLMSNGSAPVWGLGYSFTSPLSVSGTSVDLEGLSGFGTNNQILATNGTDALQYRTISAGTGVSLTFTSSSISIANTHNNYWIRNNNISSTDITTSGVDNIEIPSGQLWMNATNNLKYFQFTGTNVISTHDSAIFGNVVSINYEVGNTGKFQSSATQYLQFLSSSKNFIINYDTIDVNGQLDINSNNKITDGGSSTNYIQFQTGNYLHINTPNNSYVQGAYPIVNDSNTTNDWVQNNAGELKINYATIKHSGTFFDGYIIQCAKGRPNGYIEHYYHATATASGMYMEGTGAVRLYWNGTTVTTTGNWADISDSRVKLNQQLADTKLLSNAFDNNNDLHTYNYTEQYAIENGKSSTDTVYGFIAQNVIENKGYI